MTKRTRQGIPPPKPPRRPPSLPPNIAVHPMDRVGRKQEAAIRKRKGDRNS